MLPKLIAVVGTNASGKSGLGVRLAEYYGGEIISADSRQVVRGLDLGSGKITEDEMRGVRHHLLDVCEPGDFFSVVDFQRLSYAAIDDILSRGKQPFLVGGTGLYVSAVQEGYQMSNREPDLEYRDELRKLDTETLYAMLKEKDPETQVDAKNRNRVMRYLEKIHDGDEGPSASVPRYQVLRLGVTWERSVLNQRIDERLERRMKEGMLEEVKGLLDAGVDPVWLDRLGLEYRFISQYLLGKIATEQEMLEGLAIAIKQFAKRQMTWFRRDKEIFWLDMTGDPFMQAREIIDRFLNE